MRNVILWVLSPFLKWTTQGRPVAIVEPNGSISLRGVIVGLRIEMGSFPEVDIVREGTFKWTTFRCTKGIRWNPAAKHFELEAEHAVETSRRRRTGDPVETGDHDPRDREKAPEAPKYGQSPSREFGTPAASDGGFVGESAGRVRPGHNEDSPSESKTGRPDDPRTNTVSGGQRYKGALKPLSSEGQDGTFPASAYRLGINDDIPPGTLIAVSPDQALHITRAQGYVGALPTNSIIWGHSQTVAFIQGRVPTTKIN